MVGLSGSVMYSVVSVQLAQHNRRDLCFAMKY